MKKTVLSFLFSASVIIAAAQPKCFVVGPAYNMGSTKITNYAFSRTLGVNSDGAPINTFGDYTDATNKASSFGLLTDIYTKHWRFGMDLMLPLKNSQSNFFNLNLAYGGYIKEKVGILVGISGYANSKKYTAIPNDLKYKQLQSNEDYKRSDFYYSQAAPGSFIGANLLLTFAPTESIVFRVDIGKYIATTESKKTPYLDNYEFKRKGSTKIEFGGVWQISEYFGLFAKYAMWTTKGSVIAKNVEYTQLVNSGSVKSTISVDVTPVQTFKSNNFTFGVMIPLGSASSQRTIISAKVVN